MPTSSLDRLLLTRDSDAEQNRIGRQAGHGHLHVVCPLIRSRPGSAADAAGKLTFHGRHRVDRPKHEGRVLQDTHQGGLAVLPVPAAIVILAPGTVGVPMPTSPAIHSAPCLTRHRPLTALGDESQMRRRKSDDCYCRSQHHPRPVCPALEPAGVAGDADGVDAVTAADLGDGVGQVVADSGWAQ
jgi:hypothetical protein